MNYRDYIPAILAPLVPHAAALAANVPLSGWWSMNPSVRWSLAANALLNTAGWITLVAPIAGVAAVAAVGGAGPRAGTTAVRTITFITLPVVLFTATSALLTIGWRAGQEGTAAFVATSHGTLFVVAMALAAWGALCGSWFRHTLDAVAFSLAVVLTAAGGLLVGGAAIGEVPRPLVSAAVAANPFVAMTSAAHIDIFRMDLWYQLSPLAHVQVDYPAWQGTCGWYLAVTFVCLLTLTWRTRLRPSVPTPRG